MVSFPCSSYLFLWCFILLFSPISGLLFGGFQFKLKKPGNRREGGEFATYTDPISQVYLGGSNPSKDTSIMNINLPPEHFASYKDRISQMYLLDDRKDLNGRRL